MANIKYRIGFGNCGTGINQSITSPIDSNEVYKADTTKITADNTILTADYDNGN